MFDLIASLGDVSVAEMWEVFNMGCGFCAIVPAVDAAAAVTVLGRHHQGAAVIGRLTADSGRITIPALKLTGGSEGLRVGKSPLGSAIVHSSPIRPARP